MRSPARACPSADCSCDAFATCTVLAAVPEQPAGVEAPVGCGRTRATRGTAAAISRARCGRIRTYWTSQSTQRVQGTLLKPLVALVTTLLQATRLPAPTRSP